MTANAAVALRGVGKTFPDGTSAITPVDLAIPAGRFVGIVGPSGCGKSTLLRLIAGLIPPTAGIVTLSPADAPIGFVFQDPTLMPWATAADNIALPLRLADLPAGAIAPRVADALARVGLEGFADFYPHALSGGMQMRVSIARALVTAPALMLMDEPFAALDEFTRLRLNDDLRALWVQNRWTAIFVTHSIREAVFLSEEIIVMSPRPGKIVARMAVDLPPVRDASLRLSHAFADQCAAVSKALGAAMEDRATSAA